MRTLKLFLFSILCVTLFFSCSDSSDILGNDLETEFRSGHNDHKTVTVPFKAQYIGEYQAPGDRCPGAVNVIVEATGEGTHVGYSEAYFDFCGLPQPDFSFIYGDPFPMEATIVADNGDEIYLTGSGIVKPGRLGDHPDYVTSYWRDTFDIIGGTGRFEGATGEFMTDDYNSSLDPFSHHNWEGTITMVKGKRK